MASTPISYDESTTTDLNILEDLPNEIRHMVYSFLGFPVSNRIWLDCPGPPHCTDASHIIFHEDAKWPMEWHDLPGGFEVRKKMEQMSFAKPSAGLSNSLKLRVMYEMGGHETTTTKDIDSALLGVNRAIRTELLSLLIRNSPVRLQYPVHFQPSALAHLTHLTLLARLYIEGTTLPPQVQQATSALLAIAQHCPNLTHLTLAASEIRCLAADWRTPEYREMIKELARACHDVMDSCEKLEEFKLEWRATDKRAKARDGSADLCADQYKGKMWYTKHAFDGLLTATRPNRNHYGG